MSSKLQEIPVGINREDFLLHILSELTGSLETVVGVEEAAGFISIVGQYVGEWMESEYRKKMTDQEVRDAGLENILLDLKRRVGGDFYIQKIEKQKITLKNRRCPFGKYVEGHDALCMMTSNIFGSIAADFEDHAKVSMRKTIARGDKECEVVIYLGEQAGNDEPGREYYKIPR